MHRDVHTAIELKTKFRIHALPIESLKEHYTIYNVDTQESLLYKHKQQLLINISL